MQCVDIQPLVENCQVEIVSITFAQQHDKVEGTPVMRSKQQDRLFVQRSRQWRGLFVAAVAIFLHSFVKQGVHKSEEATPALRKARAGKNFVRWYPMDFRRFLRCRG